MRAGRPPLRFSTSIECQRESVGVLEACDVSEHLCVRELCDHVLLDLAGAAVALEEQLALALVAGKEEPHDVAGIDDDVVRGFLFVSVIAFHAHGLRPVTNCWSFW